MHLTVAVASKFIPVARLTLARFKFGSRTHLPLLKLFGGLLDVVKACVFSLFDIVRVSPIRVVNPIQLFLRDAATAMTLWTKFCARCAPLFTLRLPKAIA